MSNTALLKAGVCVALAVLAVGCATGSQVAGDKEQVSNLLEEWKEAFIANNVDQVMTFYSENFMANGRNKAGIVEEIKETIREGLADDVKINVENATVTIQGDKAVVLPIALCGQRGSATLRLDLAKENGQWLIVGMDSK